MTMELLTNTAVRIPVGPLVDPTDGKTAETGLTVTALSVQIYQTKNDGSAVVRAAFSPTTSGGSNDMALVTSSTDGMYDLEVTAAQLNFYGNARLTLYDVDGFLVWWVDIQVVSANHFNNKYGTTIPEVDLKSILGTALTETAGLLAGGFKKFFNVGSPTGTLNSIPDAVPGAAGGNFIAGSNAATSITTALTANITGNLSGSVGTVAANGITETSMATDSVNAASVKADAVTKIQNGLAPASEYDTQLDANMSTRATSAKQDTMETTLNAVPSAAQNADAVLDEVLADLADNDLNIGNSMTLRIIARALFNRFYRNVTQTSSQQIVQNDSSGNVAVMATSDDLTTQTKGPAT